jgi:LPS O-antigen subunit length determinant protein (WzzB/FepE family)
MRQLIHWTARLYPAAWRERYGEELDALVEDIQPQWEDLFNVLLGALRMQMTTRNSLKILAAATLAGALVAGVFAFRTPDRYVSTAVVRIAPADSDRQRALDRLGELQQEVLSRTSLAQIIQQPALNLYPEDRKRVPLEDVVENMRNKALRIQAAPAQNGGVPAFLISFEYPDKFKAQAVVRELLASFFRQNRLERGDQGPSAAEILEVLDPANLPQRSFYPNRPMIVAAGLLGGAVLGLLVVLVWRGAAWLGKDKKVVAAAALAGALAAGVFAFRIPDRYVSTAVMRFIPAGPADSDRQRALDRLQQMTHQIVSDRDTAFRKALRIQLLQPQGGGVRAFSISCEYPDNLKAQAVVREVVARFFRLNQGPSAVEVLEVLDPASLPARPFFPNRPMMVAAGLLGGAVLGLLAVLVWRSTLHSQK